MLENLQITRFLKYKKIYRKPDWEQINLEKNKCLRQNCKMQKHPSRPHFNFEPSFEVSWISKFAFVDPFCHLHH
jgi:hypothetical protein